MSGQLAQTDAADAAELAHYGYEQVLDRQTGKFASFAVAFAFVSIATGIFTTYGSMLITSGPLGIWTWPIVTVGQLVVALVLGALASRISVTGYSYQWMSRLGNPLLGWIIGWISFMFLAVVVVAVDYTIASSVLPALLHCGGPAGLTAAAELAPRTDGEVRVIEREADPGGIPRHSDHPGYGIRDLRRFISGPAYARRLTAMASDAGAVLQTSAMVTGWAGERTLEITSPAGRRRLRADAVVLATGARERPRPARPGPGTPPAPALV
jgi:hypothetical protein